MSDSSANGVVVVTLGLILILLLVVGGFGFYYVTARQQMAVAAAVERASANQALARFMAEEARAEADPMVAAHKNARDDESSKVQGDAIRAAVESVLRAQEEAWNRGDIDGFVDHYWKSDELTFSSEGTTTRGWNATLDRYRQRYPSREKMGRVSFGGLEIAPLGDSAALVLGTWKLDRESEPLSGNFSLVLQKLDGRWLIVHDHTSRLTE